MKGTDMSNINENGNWFNTAVGMVIDAVGGDPNQKDHHPCPICGTRALSVKAGDKRPVVIHCHGRNNDGKHDVEIIDWLRDRGAWPSSPKLDKADQKAFEAQQKRSRREQRNTAVRIWNELTNSGGRRRASPLLGNYFNERGPLIMPNDRCASFFGSFLCVMSGLR